jgi:hypothetical protein
MLCASLGEAYGLLPSQVAEKATIFDIMAADVKSSWDEYYRATPEQRAQMVGKNLKAEDLEKIMKGLKNV